MFLDQATIDVTGGRGGHGFVGWRHEKYVPMGGPSGGDGGRGGNVILVADANTDTLSDFTSRKRFLAEDGENGMLKNCHGHDGKHLVLPVPPGTVVTDAKTATLLADLKTDGDRVVIAKGGRGGYGNAHFKSSVRRKPDFAEKGEPGERRTVTLELKLVADVGIIGYPSVGKSTLISVVSSAKPKIAPYPFTTLIPNLGVVHVGGRRFVLCDVPGLIEGASKGKGLGDQFLRHIERCGILLHLLDLSRAFGTDGSLDPDVLISDYRSIRKELRAFSPALTKKTEMVVLNKTDLTTADITPLLHALRRKKITIDFVISAATKKGTDALMKTILPVVLKARQQRTAAEPTSVPTLRPHDEQHRMADFTVEKGAQRSIIVRGERLEQFTRMTNFESEGGAKRFRDVLKKIGLLATLTRYAKEKTKVFIGSVRVDGYLTK